MPSRRRLVLFCAIPISTLSAQNSSVTEILPHEPLPLISSSGIGEIKVTPDRATIRISVQTKGITATATAAENAIKQNAVLLSLRKLGIPNERLSTANYNVEPQYRYIQNNDPILTGYIVTNTIIADIYDVRQIGPAIDATLATGANMISSLDFYTSNTNLARQRAITEGVEKARGEAEAAARAIGGSLGKVLSIDIDAEFNTPPRPMYARTMATNADMVATPISPGQQTLTVRVFTRWLFVSSGTR